MDHIVFKDQDLPKEIMDHLNMISELKAEGGITIKVISISIHSGTILQYGTVNGKRYIVLQYCVSVLRKITQYYILYMSIQNSQIYKIC